MIWGWVKTLVPSEPQNSWDLWMFIPLKIVLIGIDPYPYLDPAPMIQAAIVAGSLAEGAIIGHQDQTVQGRLIRRRQGHPWCYSPGCKVRRARQLPETTKQSQAQHGGGVSWSKKLGKSSMVSNG